MEQLEIKLQLSNLRILLEFVDSKFSQYLEKNESSKQEADSKEVILEKEEESALAPVILMKT